MENIVIKYDNSQEGAFILGRLNAIPIWFIHTYKHRQFEATPTDQDDVEEIEDIIEALEFWRKELNNMANLDKEEIK